MTWLNMVASFSSIYRDLCICLSNLSVLFLSWFPLTFLNDILHFLSTIWGIGGSSLSNAKQKYLFDFFPAGKDGGGLYVLSGWFHIYEKWENAALCPYLQCLLDCRK